MEDNNVGIGLVDKVMSVKNYAVGLGLRVKKMGVRLDCCDVGDIIDLPCQKVPGPLRDQNALGPRLVKKMANAGCTKPRRQEQHRNVERQEG